MLWKLFTHFHLSVNIASVMHSYLSITSVFHSGTHICRQSRMHYCFPPCCEPGLSNEWKPFSPIPPTASDSHFSAICCSTPRSYPRCCVSPLLCPLFPQLFLLLSSSFFQSCYVSFSMKARHGLTHSANKGVCRRSFIPTKSHWSILELIHLWWQSAICGGCTKRSGLSMYFCMRNWVTTLQFNRHFKRNTTQINHQWYLRDSEAVWDALCGVPGHASLSLEPIERRMLGETAS